MRNDRSRALLILAAACAAPGAWAADSKAAAKPAPTKAKAAATPAATPVGAKAPAKIQFTDKDIERVKGGGAPAAEGPCEPTAATSDAAPNPTTAKKKPKPTSYRGSSRRYRPRTPPPDPPRPDPARPDWQSQKKEREQDAKWREKHLTEGKQADAYMDSRRRQLEREKWARQSAARSDKPLPPSGTLKDELRDKKPIK